MTLNIAHRGFSGRYPENTMLAFVQAVEAGAQGIELDVHLSKDGQAVIIHDETVDRTTNGQGRVCDKTVAELVALDAHGPFPGQYPPCPIPTLDEYFAWVQTQDIITNLELKTDIYEYPGIEQLVWDLICKYNLADKVIISSFNHYCVLRMKALAPALPCGLLTSSWIVNPGAYGKSLGIDTYHPLYGTVTPEFVEEMNQAGLKIYTYTVNDAETADKLTKLGIAGIIGNHTDMIGQVLAENMK